MSWAAWARLEEGLEGELVDLQLELRDTVETARVIILSLELISERIWGSSENGEKKKKHDLKERERGRRWRNQSDDTSSRKISKEETALEMIPLLLLLRPLNESSKDSLRTQNDGYRRGQLEAKQPFASMLTRCWRTMISTGKGS
jgi:hypothetical protein